jgi:putative hydrolase of the HAD superfamily
MEVAHFFSTVVTSVEHGKRKPTSSIFERALKITGGVCDQSIYVGDSFEADYLGSTNVGMRCLLIDPQKLHPVPHGDRLESCLESVSRRAN